MLIVVNKLPKLAKLPKTLSELHEALNNYKVITNCGENFKFTNARKKKIVLFLLLNIIWKCSTKYISCLLLELLNYPIVSAFYYTECKG